MLDQLREVTVQVAVGPCPPAAGRGVQQGRGHIVPMATLTVLVHGVEARQAIGRLGITVLVILARVVEQVVLVCQTTNLKGRKRVDSISNYSVQASRMTLSVVGTHLQTLCGFKERRQGAASHVDLTLVHEIEQGAHF